MSRVLAGTHSLKLMKKAPACALDLANTSICFMQFARDGSGEVC